MSRSSSRQLPSPDWQASLLEAIQQRDAPRAIALAQRCVHRQGMAKLEALLDRADRGAEAQGEARTWLLLLLKQAQNPAPAIASPPASEPEDAPSPSPSPSPLATPPSPLATPPSLSTPPSVATPPERAMTPEREMTPERAMTQESAMAPERAMTPEAPSAALDQAFAPLEIAFPPLPASKGPEGSAPWPEPAAPLPPLGDPAPFRESRGLRIGLPGPSPGSEPAGSPDPSSGVREPSGSGPFSALENPSKPSFENLSPPPSPPPAPPTPPPPPPPDRQIPADGMVAGPAQPSIPPAPGGASVDDFSAGVAAPVPTFHVESMEEWPSVDARKRARPQKPDQESARESNALQAWRAWLPGHFRSRPRS